MNCHSVPYGGRLEYLHHSPTNHRRQQRGNPVPGSVSGPPCHWVHKYRDLVLQVGGWMQGWQPCSVRKISVVNSKEVKTRWSNSRQNRQIWQDLLRKTMAQKGCFADDNGGGGGNLLLFLHVISYIRIRFHNKFQDVRRESKQWVLIEERLDEISAGIEHSPRKSLRCLVQETGYQIHTIS
jgi:hypothetical protein